MKKYLMGLVVFSFTVICLFPQNKEFSIKELESKLNKSSGKKRIEILVKLTEKYSQQQQNKALQYGKEAEELIKKYPYEELEVLLYNSIASAYALQGVHDLGEKYAQKALKIAKKRKDKGGYAFATYRIGHLEYQRGNYSNAIDLLTESREIFESIKDWGNVANCWNTIGLLYWRIQDHSKALECVIKSANMYERIGDKIATARVHNSFGVIYMGMGDLKKALEHYNKALDISQQENYLFGIIIMKNNIAFVLSIQGKYKESLKIYEEVLKLSEELGLRSEYSNILYNMGENYVNLHEYPKAMQFYREALRIREATGDQDGIAETLVGLGQLNRKLKNYQEAINNLNRAIIIASEIESKDHTRKAYHELSQVFEAQGHSSMALANYKKYKKISDSIFNEDNSQRIAEMQTRFELERKEKEIALLKKDNEIKQLNYSQQRNLKNSFFIISILVLVLVFVVYARYRFKIKVNRVLKKEIYEHQQTSEQLRESEEKFRALAEKSVVGIFIIQDEMFKYANPRFLKIFNYCEDEIIGQHHLKTVAEEDRGLMIQSIQKLLKNKIDSLSRQFKGITKNKEIKHIEVYETRIQYDGTPAIMGTLIDVTDKKKAEAELLKSQKLESIGILAGGIAHDFNNLLTIISGNLSMALEEVKEDRHITPMLKSAEKSSHQAAELTQKLITFSKGGWLNPQKITVSSILKSTMDFYPHMQVLFKKAKLKIPENLNPIYGDERQLRQVIHNVLQNANEFISEGTEITIQAQNISLDEGMAKNFSIKKGEYVQLSIIDNGKGIPHELLQYIFDPYMSTKEMVTQKGLGLGLAICYSIIKKHQGHITVDSVLGEGTTVNLYLPAYYLGINGSQN